MNKEFKRHLVSAGITFGSTFIAILAVTFQDPTFSFSKEALGVALTSAFLAGVRTVAKLIVEWNSSK